jgi:hypothetical protein
MVLREIGVLASAVMIELRRDDIVRLVRADLGPRGGATAGRAGDERAPT